MGMLDRYKKSGGFKQLLQLIETCGAVKQEKFLKMIEEEDPIWAAAIRGKMLTMEKVFSWDSNTVAEIFTRLQDLTLATAMHSFTDEQTEKVFETFTHMHRRKIEDLRESKKPSAGEIATANMKVLEEARSMISQGYLRMDTVDPSMIVEDDIEEKLLNGTVDLTSLPEIASTSPSAEPDKPFEIDNVIANVGKASSEDVKKLTMKLELMVNENSKLKKENALLKGKLEQIKKIA